MFYFVREGYQDALISEGFCEKLSITNEMLRGGIRIDGQHFVPLDIGDRIALSMDPKDSLRCL